MISHGSSAFLVVFCVCLLAGPLSREAFSQETEAEAQPSEVASRAISAIRSLDRDRNGVISLSEIPVRMRSRIFEVARQAGIRSGEPIQVARLVSALGGDAGEKKDAAEPRAESNDRGKSDGPVPGFGATVERPAVPGFGEVVADDSKRRDSVGGSSRSTPASTSKSGSASPAAPSEKIRRYAEALMKQYDRNKNGVLEKDEWSKMRGRPEESDTNKDGVLTLAELTNRLANYSQRSSTSSANSSGSKSTTSTAASRPGSSPYTRRSYRSSSSKRGEEKRKSYRFLSPLERLPDGLPDWFTRNDGDGDGQISMSEYSVTWNDAKAEEFRKNDLDGDGLITVEECLAAKSAAAKR